MQYFLFSIAIFSTAMANPLPNALLELGKSFEISSSQDDLAFYPSHDIFTEHGSSPNAKDDFSGDISYEFSVGSPDEASLQDGNVAAYDRWMTPEDRTFTNFPCDKTKSVCCDPKLLESARLQPYPCDKSAQSSFLLF